MEITEVRIKLIQLVDDRLQAFCSITFDNAFVVRDLKIIDGPQGPFVAMPSRKVMGHCTTCGYKNHLRAAYCNQCGHKLRIADPRDSEGRSKLYADIAHPINAQSREMIQRVVVQAFREELEKSQLPGYLSRYEEEYDDFGVDPELSADPRQHRSDKPHPAGKPPLRYGTGSTSDPISGRDH
ncbi:MAG TPA: SpoVG family protein [Pirellulaceae bacterium]